MTDDSGPSTSSSRHLLVDLMMSFTPFALKSDIMRQPLEQSLPRSYWDGRSSEYANSVSLRWLLGAIYSLVVGLGVLWLTHLHNADAVPERWWMVFVLVAPAVCVAQMVRWSYRSSRFGKAWRGRRMAEAEARIAAGAPYIFDDRPPGSRA